MSFVNFVTTTAAASRSIATRGTVRSDDGFARDLFLRRGRRFGGRLLRGGSVARFVGSRAGQDADHRMVAFVAGVLVDLVVGQLQPNHEGPGLRPGLRVVNRDLPV